MRLILVGTVTSTRTALDVLISEHVPPLALVTLPPSHSKRHSNYKNLGSYALSQGIEVIYTSDVNDPSVLSKLSTYDPEYIFVIGWSQICSNAFLGITRNGCIGFHPAPLPKLRGRAVIPWTIILGETETGSTLFWMNSGVDSGPILCQERFAVDEHETAGTLLAKHCCALERMLRTSIKKLVNGEQPSVPQDESIATYCAKRIPDDGFIDWNQPAKKVHALIRALSKPYPGAFTVTPDMRKITIWSAEYIGEGPFIGLAGQVQQLDSTGAIVQCGDGNHLRLSRVQIEGQDETNASAVLKRHVRLGLTPWQLFRMGVI